MPRSDARDNRERILTAARDVFATDGLAVPMRVVARRAEVGPATLYRHFPTKEQLITEAFTGQMRVCADIVAAGLADPDPWRGFRVAIEHLCEMHVRDRGFTAAFMSAFPDSVDFVAARADSMSAMADLLRRAKETGRMRADVVFDDIVLILMANSGIRAATEAAAVAASRRFATLAIQGLRALPADAA